MKSVAAWYSDLMNKMRNIIRKRYMGHFLLLTNNMHCDKRKWNKSGVRLQLYKGLNNLPWDKLHNIQKPPALDYKFQHLTHKYNFNFFFSYRSAKLYKCHFLFLCHTWHITNARAHRIDSIRFDFSHTISQCNFIRPHILYWFECSMIFRNTSINIRRIRRF